MQKPEGDTLVRVGGTSLEGRPCAQVVPSKNGKYLFVHTGDKPLSVLDITDLADIREVRRDKGVPGLLYHRQPHEFLYENGIRDYVAELSGLDALTSVQSAKTERVGRDREDKPEYRFKVEAAFCFCNINPRCEYYHNSSWLEYGGAPDKAVRSAFVSALDAFM